MDLSAYLKEELGVDSDLDDAMIEPAFTYDTFKLFTEEDDQ